MKNPLINKLFEQENLFSFLDDSVCSIIDSSFDSYKFRTTLDDQADAYVMHIQVPGLSREDIEVTVDNGILSVCGEKTINSQMNASVNKRLTLGRDIDSSKITAKVENGILELNVPKNEKSKTRKIKIN